MKNNWRKPGLLSCISQKLLIFNGLFRSALIKAADTFSLRVYECFQAHQCQHRESQSWAPQIFCLLPLVVQAVRIPRLQHLSGCALGGWVADGQSEPAALRVNQQRLCRCHLHVWPFLPHPVLEWLDLLLSFLVRTAPVFLPQHSPLQWLSPPGVF